LGKPILNFIKDAQAFLSEKGIEESHVSISDEQDFAVAFVTLVKG